MVADVARSQWRTAARMIVDLDPSPRRLRLTAETELCVGKGTADLKVGLAGTEATVEDEGLA